MFSTQSTQSFTEGDYNKLTAKIIDCCVEVHKVLGPGLMESVYEICATHVMKKNGLWVQNQVVLPVNFRGETINKGFVIDLLVEDKVILAFKSVETILPVHEAQLVTYLKLANKRIGLLINFNEALLKDGIRRKINGDLSSV